jgi:hypothetical protein
LAADEYREVDVRIGGFRKGPFEMLEPDEGKLSSPVLRGPGRSNPARLPDRPDAVIRAVLPLLLAIGCSILLR